MTLYSVLLSLHLAGAFTTLGVGGFTFAHLVKKTEESYAPLARILALCAGYQTLTGALLALVSPSVTAVSLCSNLGLYLAPILALETVLVLRMKATGTPVPVARMVYPFLTSAFSFASVAVLGL